MKKIILLMIMSMLFLTGCIGIVKSEPMKGIEAKAAETEIPSKEKKQAEEAETEMKKEENTNMTQIAEAIGCPEEKAASIWKGIQETEVPVGELARVEKAEDETDYSIRITNTDGKQYQIGIDKTYFVYSVKDMDTNEYVYAVYE